MNRLEEIQEIVKNFILGKSETKNKIKEIENKRNQLAEIRNAKKIEIQTAETQAEINELGKEISELGIKSQNMQKELDSQNLHVKPEIDMQINNEISERIREIRRAEEIKTELEEKITTNDQKQKRYEEQRQEFFNKFGRMPELSLLAQKEISKQQQDIENKEQELNEYKQKIENIQEELEKLTTIKSDFEAGKISEFEKGEDNNIENQIEKLVANMIEEQVENIVEEEKAEPIEIEEINLNEIQPLEEKQEEKVETIQKIEEAEPEEKTFDIEVEEIATNEETSNSIDKVMEESQQIDTVDIEEIIKQAMQKIEEATAQNVEPITENEEEIVTNEEEAEPEEVFVGPVKLVGITTKIEDGKIVYKAEMNNGETIKAVLTESRRTSARESREKIKGLLINYAVAEYRMLDKNVIKRIDPIICEILNTFAKKYNYDSQNLIYNYAMSFSKNEAIEIDFMPNIVYNFLQIEESDVDDKDKKYLKKVCKNANKNDRIEVIEKIRGIQKIKCMLKRLLNSNGTKALSEGKY